MSKFLFPAMHDEEKFLMERESEIYEEKISKICARSAMHRTKRDGYGSVRKGDIPLIKIFIGYASQLGLFRDPELMDALSLSVADSTAGPRLELILGQGFTELADILGVLGHSSYTPPRDGSNEGRQKMGLRGGSS